jgi:hypothetical protein
MTKAMTMDGEIVEPRFILVRVEVECFSTYKAKKSREEGMGWNCVFFS